MNTKKLMIYRISTRPQSRDISPKPRVDEAVLTPAAPTTPLATAALTAYSVVSSPVYVKLGSEADTDFAVYGFLRRSYISLGVLKVTLAFESFRMFSLGVMVISNGEYLIAWFVDALMLQLNSEISSTSTSTVPSISPTATSFQERIRTISVVVVLLT
jgi:hypothetical protein